MHGMRNSAGPFAASLVTGLVLALLLWGGELVRYNSPGWLTSFAGLFFLLVVLLPLALGIGTYYAVVSGGENPYVRLADATSSGGRFLSTPDCQKGWRVFNGIFWVFLYLSSTILLSYLLSHEIAVEIVRPRYQAILSLASVAGSVILFLPLLRFGFAIGRRLESRANGIPGLRQLWARPLYPILLLTVVVRRHTGSPLATPHADGRHRPLRNGAGRNDLSGILHALAHHSGGYFLAEHHHYLRPGRTEPLWQ